jgi:hypothetical protein
MPLPWKVPPPRTKRTKSKPARALPPQYLICPNPECRQPAFVPRDLILLRRQSR